MPNRAGLVPADKAYLEALREVTREVGAADLRRGHHLSPGLSRRAGALGHRSRPDDARQDHRRRLPGRRRRRQDGIHGGLGSVDGKPALPHGGTFYANPITMRAGMAAMELLDQAAFARLDAIGEAVRGGIDAAFPERRARPHGRARSLSKIQFADRSIRDYRSAYFFEPETQRQAIFNRGLLDRGVLAAGYGLMALSTPMTDADIDTMIAAHRRTGGGSGIDLLRSTESRSNFFVSKGECPAPSIHHAIRLQHRLSSIVKEMGEAMFAPPIRRSLIPAAISRWRSATRERA